MITESAKKNGAMCSLIMYLFNIFIYKCFLFHSHSHFHNRFRNPNHLLIMRIDKNKNKNMIMTFDYDAYYYELFSVNSI